MIKSVQVACTDVTTTTCLISGSQHLFSLKYYNKHRTKYFQKYIRQQRTQRNGTSYVLSAFRVDSLAAPSRFLADHDALQLRVHDGHAEGVFKWDDLNLQGRFGVLQKLLESLHSHRVRLNQLLQNFFWNQREAEVSQKFLKSCALQKYPFSWKFPLFCRVTVTDFKVLYWDFVW